MIFLGTKYEPLSDPAVIKICEWGPWEESYDAFIFAKLVYVCQEMGKQIPSTSLSNLLLAQITCKRNLLRIYGFSFHSWDVLNCW